MKAKTFTLFFLLGFFIFMTSNVFAQTVDSVQTNNADQISKEKQDEQRLQNAVDLKREMKSDAKVAKANSKEANRIEGDAVNAAKEAKQAARMEAKAQRNRENADKQAKKAARASEKSNKN